MTATRSMPNSPRRPVIGMLQQNLFDICAEQTLGAVDAAIQHQCDLITFCGRSLEDTGFQKQANAIYDLVTPESVDCVIAWASTLGIHVGAEELEAFCSRFGPIPVVTVEQSVGDVPMVLLDNRTGMRDAVDHLIEAHGHTRIAFVRGPATHYSTEERYRGYLEALANHGLAVVPGLVSPHAASWDSTDDASPDTIVLGGPTSANDHDVFSGAAAHAIEMDREWVAHILAYPPDAIAAANDGFAAAMVSLLAMVGLRVPEDVAVVGFNGSDNVTADDLGFGATAEGGSGTVDTLSLTTVRAPFRELGHRAIEVAKHLLDGEPVDDVITVPVELVIRRSCGCAPGDSDTPDDLPAQRHVQLIAEKRSQIIREIGEELVVANSVAEFLKILPGTLRKVGIPVCGLVSYHGDVPADDVASAPAYLRQTGTTATAWSELMFVYRDGIPVEITPEMAIFRSAELIPGNLMRRAAPRSTVLAPVYFRDEQMGYLLLEMGPRLGWIYETLQSQLSATLHRVFMVEREHAALAAIEEAHRREERQRLAGDLHDSVSQALFSMTLRTRALELMSEREEAIPIKFTHGLGELRALTQTALAEMRALIFQLRPDALHNDGLVEAIRKQATALAVREDMDIQVETSREHFPLAERTESELFLFVREAIHNSVRHAQSESVTVRLGEPVDGTLEIEIRDDGSGFDPALRRPGHYGLDTMRERVEGLGGALTIDSAPNTSTTIRAVLPHILN
jgi:signal transduction histidine kinase/DNA-binding LacI/PurR family transcriptional regulator